MGEEDSANSLWGVWTESVASRFRSAISRTISTLDVLSLMNYTFSYLRRI